MNKSLVWSYRNRLMMNTMTIWNNNLRELQNLEENSDIAVWHWSIKFQIKAIQAWRSYTKKEKLLKHQKEIEIIRLLGGEPFLDNNFLKFLQGLDLPKVGEPTKISS